MVRFLACFLTVGFTSLAVGGISLGYADESHPVNTLVAEREPVESFATFHGF